MKKAPLIVAALVLHVLPFATRPALIGGDEPHYALMAHSIAVDHDLDLTDDYAAVERGSNAAGRKHSGEVLGRHLRPYHGRRVFSHPLGLPLLVAPALWLQHAVAPGAAPDLLLGLIGLALTFAALMCGWRLLARHLGDDRTAALVVFAVYFATPCWYYSRTFYTEPYTWALAVLAIAAIDRRRWVVASLLLGVVFALKEAAILLVVPIVVFVAVSRGLRRAALLAVGPGIAVALFLAKNFVVYGSPLVTYQRFKMGSPLRAAVGLLIDPQHGLFVFAPVLLLACFGWMKIPRRAFRSSPLPYAAFVAVSYFVLTAAWVDWRGGSSFGPRLLVPAIPAFALPLAAIVRPVRRTIASRIALYAAVAAGFALEFCAAVDPFHAMWSPSVKHLVLLRPGAAAFGLVLGLIIVYLLDRRSEEPELVGDRKPPITEN